MWAMREARPLLTSGSDDEHVRAMLYVGPACLAGLQHG